MSDSIRPKFKVRYHRDHVGRLMHSLKWSPQKPERRALERKDAEIERWKKEEWPRVKKTLRGWAPTSYLPTRSEEHTSELQSRGQLVCRLLLEKKKKSA